MLGENERPQITVRSADVEILPPTAGSRRKYYVPDALRIGVLVAFCIITLTVSTLLQVASAAYLDAHGHESLAVYSSNAKRAARPQTPNPGPAQPPPPTAPGPGSYSSASSLYFLGAYVPTLVAILFSVWWKCVFARLKEMEPYYQLSKPEGAEAKDSLLLSYSSAMLPLVFLKSLRSRHWLTFLGAVNMVLITLCTLFAAETLHLKGVGDGCGVKADAQGDSNQDCEMQLAMQPALGFLLGVILLAVFLATLFLLIKLHRCSCALFADATSIAGIASLTNQSLAQEFPQTLQTPSRRFELAFSDADGTNSIIETTPALHHHTIWPSHLFNTSTSRPKRESDWEMRPLSLVIFLFFQTGILILILYYRYVSKPGTNNPLEDFMNSESFGVRLFMTILGLGTKFYWGWIEKYVRHISPYVALASSDGATAEQSVLMKSSSHPFMSLFSRSTWRYALLGLVTVLAVVSEVLVVMLNTVPFTRTTAYMAFEVSVYISTAILSLMILTIPAILLWIVRIKRRGDLPEVPECITDVFEMIGNEGVWDDLGMLNENEREKVVRSWGVKFAMRKMQEKWRLVTL
jgi:hypothetical protein